MILSLLLPAAASAKDPRILSVEDHQQHVADPAAWEQVWADEFEGPGIDPERWGLVEAGGGFGNNELQYYAARPTNAYTRNGCLVIQALKEDFLDHAYTSAKLQTSGRASWTYGKFEVRAKLPRGQGIWPAIWMMPDRHDGHGGWPVCGEIDIMELVGYAPGTVYGTLHYGNPWRNTGGHHALEAGRTYADDFHVFTMEWAPGVFRWYVDGNLFHTETEWYTSEPGALWPAPFSKPFYLQMNVAVGGNWPGAPDATTVFPQRMQVDYVRVYRFLDTYPEVEKRSAALRPPTPRKPLPDGNQVYNGSFEEGEDYWTLLVQEGGQAQLSVEDGTLGVTRLAPGSQRWSIQLTQRPLHFEKEARYTITFSARADEATDMEVSAGKASQHWDSYSGKRMVALGKEMADYAVDFRMWAKTDPEARLEFNLGEGAATTVFLDDVRVALLARATPQILGRELLLEAEANDEMSGLNSQPCAEGGLNIGWWDPGDWLDFKVDVAAAGMYRADIRYAAMDPGAELEIVAGSGDPATRTLPVTGKWQQWMTIPVQLRLTEGPQRIRVRCISPGFNLNWIRFRRVEEDREASGS